MRYGVQRHQWRDDGVNAALRDRAAEMLTGQPDLLISSRPSDGDPVAGNAVADPDYGGNQPDAGRSGRKCKRERRTFQRVGSASRTAPAPKRNATRRRFPGRTCSRRARSS